ncbi:DUF3299 domain-containing protein [Planctobacterium marinum]|uniref:DUF3299 domain-containing protein n=1 Tax=Planctobacterium marinum TaxID=1631968 RepID=A0AA48KSH6_9ALTE|nr:hypothetical protein MACH26_41340 [Planctobacterium marinum]
MGLAVAFYKPWDWFELDNNTLYQSDEYDSTVVSVPISWQALLGNTDRQLLQNLRDKKTQLNQQFPEGTELSMESELLASALTAQTWQSLDGYQINADVVGQYASLPGFLVPLELNEGKVRSFFIVPYYGACLHYPPPPPNQIVYVQLPDYIPLPDMQLAYKFTGVLSETLFEDPMGTSAWGMDVSAISAYSAPTDDVRVH